MRSTKYCDADLLQRPSAGERNSDEGPRLRQGRARPELQERLSVYFAVPNRNHRACASKYQSASSLVCMSPTQRNQYAMRMVKVREAGTCCSAVDRYGHATSRA